MEYRENVEKRVSLVLLLQAIFPNAYREFLKMVDEMTEDQIPKFLRIIPNEEEKELSRFDKMLDKYEKKFGNM